MKLARAAVAATLLAACSRDPAAPVAAAAPPTPSPAPAAGAAPVPSPSPPTRGAPRAEAPAPELTLAAFKSFTKKRSAEVRRCYEAALANETSLRGKLTLTFAILPGGGVSDVRVARSTFRSATVPSCIASVVRAWKTPFRPAEPVEVEYPIDLRPR